MNKRLLILLICKAWVPLAHASLFSTTMDTATFIASPGTWPVVEDPYRWLEEGRSAQVKAWEASQNQAARDYLSNLPNRQTLEHRLKELSEEQDVSVPLEANGRIFFTRRPAGKYPWTVYWHTVGGEDIDHVLLRPRRNTNDALENLFASPDGRKLAYQLKNRLGEIFLHVRHVDSWHESAKDVLPATSANVSWAENSQGFYYVHRSTESDVRFHFLGMRPERDPIVFPKTGNTQLTLSPTLSSDGQWLFVSVMNEFGGTSVFFREIHTNSPAFRPLFVSTTTTAQVIEWGGVLYIKTNEGAPHSQIFKTYVRQTDPSFWTVLVPERPDTTLLSMKFIGTYLVLKILRNNMVGIEVRKQDGSLVRTDLQPVLGEVRDIGGRDSSDSAYYDFDSAVVPPEIYRLTLQNGTTTRWSSPRHTIDASLYEATQVQYRSKEGAFIPMFIVQRKGSPHDGSVPFLMKTDAADGTSAYLRYDPTVIPWLEAGGGLAWLGNDFIAAAEYLIENKYTSPERLVIQGELNATTAIGEAMMDRPDLFHAVVYKKPLWEASPSHHVSTGIAYPSMLIIAPEKGDSVDPMYARKLTAALQAATTTYHTPILYETARSPWEEALDRLSFLMDVVGLKPSH